MPQAHQLNIKNQSPQRRTFSIGKAGRVENGSKQPLPIKELQNNKKTGECKA